jgi:hypothetical protein
VWEGIGRDNQKSMGMTVRGGGEELERMKRSKRGQQGRQEED